MAQRTTYRFLVEGLDLARAGKHLLLASTLLPLAGCDTGSAPAVIGARHDTLTSFETVVSTASGLVGYPLDLTTGPGERIFIADARGRKVLSVCFDGTEPLTIGREGSGPGEFLQPMRIFATADSLFVYDGRHQRVMIFDLEGLFSHAYVVALDGGRGRAFGPDGRFLVSTNGHDSALAVVVDDQGQPTVSVGEPVVPPPPFFDFVSMKERASRGVVPQEHLNDVLPAMAPDGSFFVSFFSEAEARRYAPDGTVLWTVSLAEPVLHQAFDAFVRANAEDSLPFRLTPLTYVWDTEVVDGDLWLLVNGRAGTDGLILVLDGEDGSVKRRLTLAGMPGLRSFTYDSETRLLILGLPDDAMVLSALVPAFP
jgi:hypothetical protein